MVNNYRPGSVCFILNKKCNSNCKSCGVNRKDSGELPTETVYDITDQASKEGIRDVFFTGGEPLFSRYSNLISCIENVKYNKMKSRLVTNAYQAKDSATAQRIAKELSEAGNVGISVSLDWDHAEFVDPTRVKNMIAASIDNGMEVTVYVRDRNSTKAENDSLIQELAKSMGGILNDDIMHLGSTLIPIKREPVQKFGSAALLAGSEFVTMPINQKAECSNSIQSLIVDDRGNFRSCCSFQGLENDVYCAGNAGGTTVKEAIRNTNESIVGGLIMGPHGLGRARNALKESKIADLVKIADKGYNSGCESCNEFLTKPKSKDFLLSEFEKSKGVNPVFSFDGDFAFEETAKVNVNGVQTDFLNYPGAVAVGDYYASVYSHNLNRLEALAKKTGKDLSDAIDANKAGLAHMRMLQKEDADSK